MYLSESGGLVSPILAFSGKLPGTAGLVGKVSPVQFDVQFAKVRRCILSSFTSFPICNSRVPAESMSAAGLATDVYTSVPSFDATIDITTLPTFGVSEFGEDGFEPFYS